jgi:hypothetical protein
MRAAGRRDAEAWLTELGGRLPRHHEVLARLVEGARGDRRIVQFSIGCSVVRGAADDLSDLDCELSLEPDAWPSGLELVEPWVRSAGEVVDLLHHRLDGTGEGRRTAVVYANGVQLDLMVWPVTLWSGMHPPDTVVLHATREVFTRPWDPARATPAVEKLREWYFLGWWALLDAGKYLHRESPWEARQRLEEARNFAWRLCAAAQGALHPEYGITSILDAPAPHIPPGVEATATGLDLPALRSAMRRCADFLDAQWASAITARSEPPDEAASRLASWARRMLNM